MYCPARLLHSIVTQWGVHSNEAFKEVPKCQSQEGNISVVCNRTKSTTVLRYLTSHNIKCMKVLVDVDGFPEKICTVDFVTVPQLQSSCLRQQKG